MNVDSYVALTHSVHSVHSYPFAQLSYAPCSPSDFDGNVVFNFGFDLYVDVDVHVDVNADGEYKCT